MADPAQADDAKVSAKKKSNRKLSWVGVDEDTPFSYLRESMVSSLMGGICDPQFTISELDSSSFNVDPERRRAVEDAIGEWSFSAHNFSDDELMYANLVILQHALQMPELEQWRISTDELISFLFASRAAYNDFVLYHNFRHVSDVLQAIFFFLCSIGTLPPYPPNSPPRYSGFCAIAQLLKPFDGLTLLISAIGHDVGHPGVNNAFLVALNAPLAQLYNDRSVLESFHCAAYSQILRRRWPQAFQDAKMRKLMIESILATDMGLHFKYMSDLGNLQEKLAHNNRTADGWSVKVLEEYRDLTCGLLIKCADISNVARKFDVAAEWANILTDEFSNQGRMENRLGIPTTLFGGPPVQNDRVKLGQSQIGFMNVFARPLFDAVTDILPAMQFCVDELANNKERWEKEIQKEKESQLKAGLGHLGKAPGLLRLRGLKHFDGPPDTPSPKSGTQEFMLHVPPTSTASPDGKSQSDPHPFASVEAQAEAKRRILNPSNFDFTSDNNSNAAAATTTIDAPALSPATQTSTSNNTMHTPTTSPSSRRGSADPSLTAILVTQSAGSGAAVNSADKGGGGGGKKKKDSHQQRSSGASSDTAGCGPGSVALRSLSPGARKKAAASKNSPAASDSRVVLAPDENVGAGAMLADDSGAGGAVALNGAAVAPSSGAAGGAGGEKRVRSEQQQKSRGMAPAGASSRALSERPRTAGGDEVGGGGGGKERRGKFSKFWKKTWRAAISGDGGVGSGGGSEREKNGAATGEKKERELHRRRGPPMDDLRQVEASLPTPRR